MRISRRPSRHSRSSQHGSSSRAWTPSRAARAAVLFAVWATVTYFLIRHQWVGGGPEGTPGADALSPMSGLLSIPGLIAHGTYLPHVYPSSVLLAVFVVITAAIFRRGFCGWICPLGAMQEFVAGIGWHFGLGRSLQDSRVDSLLRWTKYAVLGVAVVGTAMSGELFFRHVNPWTAYAQIPAGMDALADGFGPGMLILAGVLIGSLFVERAFCRYLCPLGGFLGIVSQIGLTTVARNERNCMHCDRCEHLCPVDITILGVDEVRSPECLTCGECVAICPSRNCLNMRVFSQNLSPPGIGMLVLTLFFGLMYISQYTPYWQANPASWAEVVGSGENLDPKAVKGYMTLRDIQRAYHLSRDDLIEQLKLPAYVNPDRQIRALMAGRDDGMAQVQAAIEELLEKNDTQHPQQRREREDDTGSPGISFFDGQILQISPPSVVSRAQISTESRHRYSQRRFCAKKRGEKGRSQQVRG